MLTQTTPKDLVNKTKLTGEQNDQSKSDFNKSQHGNETTTGAGLLGQQGRNQSIQMTDDLDLKSVSMTKKLEAKLLNQTPTTHC